MLKNITGTLALSLLVSIQGFANNQLKNTQFYSENLLEYFGTRFANLEHKNIGDLVQLNLNEPKNTKGFFMLTLPNGIKLTYGEIVMHGGDVFGDVKKPISSCSAANRTSCFRSHFNTLAIVSTKNNKKCSNPLTISKNVNLYMDEIENELQIARQNGIEDSAYYDKEDTAITKKLNRLTCGGSMISDFFPFGNYLELAQVNFDHFVPDSLVAYKAGHLYALETAQLGYKKKQAGLINDANQLLVLAYAQNAFANHFLTDSFAAGHMRTPRRAIAEQVQLPAILQLLLANIMHSEDNKTGLNVVNAEGTSWTAYGDGYLNNSAAQTQQLVMLQAMQRSADGIYNTFTTGVIPDTYPEMALLPDYDKLDKLNQTSPLFKVENGVLLKRVDNHNPYDYNWTPYWSALATLLEFKLID